MSGQDYLVAIDQGTTSTRAILFDTDGAVRYVARRDLRQIYPQPGWVEHDPEEIWQAVVATCREAIAAADRPVAAIGITNQRETTVLWDRAEGRPVHNAIVWQDRRTTPICERWRTQGFAASVAARTGLVIDPYFSASKIRWLLDNVPGLAAREVVVAALGTVYSLGASSNAEAALRPMIAGSWSLATALSLLAWYVFAPQCLSTLVTVRRETNTWRYPAIMAGYLFVVAYLAALLTYHVALSLGAGHVSGA